MSPFNKDVRITRGVGMDGRWTGDVKNENSNKEKGGMDVGLIDEESKRRGATLRN